MNLRYFYLFLHRHWWLFIRDNSCISYSTIYFFFKCHEELSSKSTKRIGNFWWFWFSRTGCYLRLSLRNVFTSRLQSQELLCCPFPILAQLHGRLLCLLSEQILGSKSTSSQDVNLNYPFIVIDVKNSEWHQLQGDFW